MLYRAEVMVGGDVVSAKNYRGMSNPYQVMSQATKPFKQATVPFMKIYVMNEERKVWTSVLRKKGSKYVAKRTGTYRDYVRKDDYIDVMAGNKTIREALA